MVRKIFKRDKGICVYCGAPAQEVDHVIPVMDGGRPISSNLVCVCRHCNCAKNYQIFRDEQWLTTAIFHLLNNHEDTDWMDEYYK